MSKRLRSYFAGQICPMLPEMILGAVVSLCLYLGIILSLTSMFGLQYHDWLVTATGILLILLINFFWKKRAVIYGLLFVITGFFVIGFALGSKFTAGGLFVLLNQAIETIGKNTPHLYTKFATTVSEENLLLYATFFMMLFSGVVSCLCSISARGKHLSIPAVFSLILMILTVVFGVAPGQMAALLLAGSLLFIAGLAGTSTRKVKKQLVTIACMVGILLIAGGIAQLIAGSGPVHPVFENVVEKIRYEKRPVDSYPKGRLSRLETVGKKEGAALFVTMENPQPMYLRGFVGSSFDDMDWQELSYETNYENASLFYWLHKQDFYGQSQLYRLNQLFTFGSEEKSPGKVQVKNMNADSRYVYLPYEVTDPEKFDVIKNSDVNSVTTSFFGLRNYEFHVCEPVWDKLVSMDARLFELQNRQVEEADAYISGESYYNAFAYKTFTSLTAEQKEVFERLLNKPAVVGNGHIDYEQAKILISQFLSETLIYDEKANYEAKDEDFLRSLLMEKKKGCDIHYATVAALIYRYLGIPARYVEGYTVTVQDAEDMKPGEAFVVSGNRAHAWVEVYQDTIGWVPVEFAPGYGEAMGLPDSEN